MLRQSGPGLSGDLITFREGFDGKEAEERCRYWESRWRHFGPRFTLAIDTYYPELNGSFYENRALFVLIDDCLRELGLHPILYEMYRSEGLVPVEERGHLLLDEEYALANSDGKQLGVLALWRFSAGGGGRYYEDRDIFEFVLPQPLVAQLRERVKAACDQSNVAYEEHEPCAPSPIKTCWLTRQVRRLF